MTRVSHDLAESMSASPTLLLREIDERTSVVAPAGLDGDGSSCGANFYPVVSRVAVVALGHVGQGVLVAGLFRDLGIEPFHGTASRGVVDVAARVAPVIDEAGKFARGNDADDGQAVDGDVVVKEGIEGVGVGEVVELGAVHAIGDQEDDLAATCSAIMK
jgi:hypothetical protein